MINDSSIRLGHGSGGTMMKHLIDDIFYASYGNNTLLSGDDSALLDFNNIASMHNIKSWDLAFSTDSFVVTPQFFDGGNIGKLAICGTVNDIATSGAIPIAISLSMILEEGYPIANLVKVCKTIKEVANEAGVIIATGDTKVVEKGKCDSIFINTTGIGIKDKKHNLSGKNCRPGDKIILSGTIADHGSTIMSNRLNIKKNEDVKSDAAPLNKLALEILEAAPNTRAFRDPTRGGLASTLNEFANQSNVSITIDEEKIPVKRSVLGICELLGLDYLQVANEGKFVICIPEDEVADALNACKNNKYGKDAAIIGTVEENCDSNINKVFLKTAFGSKRIVDMLVGEQLPRIC